MKIDINELVAIARENHALCLKNGFYDEFKHTDGRVIFTAKLVMNRLILISGEVSEFVEAWRVGKIQPSVLPTAANYKTHGKDYMSEELADIVLRCLDFAACIENHNEGSDLYSAANFGLAHSGTLRALGTEATDEVVWSMQTLCYSTHPKSLYNEGWQLLRKLFAIVGNAFLLARLYQIDLMPHIHAKFAYNKTREHRHGKAF